MNNVEIVSTLKDLSFLITSAVALTIGAGLGYFARQSIAKKQINTAEAKTTKMVNDAKAEAKEILLTARTKVVKALEEIKNTEKESQRHLERLEVKIDQREKSLDISIQNLKKDRQEINEKLQKIKQIKGEIEALKEQGMQILEKTANFSQEEAKEKLLVLAEEKYKQDLTKKLLKLEQEEKTALERKSQEIICQAIQRYAASQAAEMTTTSVTLPNEDLKGRIIGKEGRNIKTLERLTGVEIIIDDTPDTILVSGFNPIRRQIAKMALEKLMADGRIQPTRIEEMVEKAKEEINFKIQEAGETAVYDTGVVGLDPKLIHILGRLRFRTSYGQNVLIHSVEVAHLAGSLAAELGADAAIAKKAGLLHDIGKAVDHEVQGSHVEIGQKILKKFNIDEKIIGAMRAHHEEYPYESFESMIVQAADAISASRPGARKDNLENYLKRLEELEDIANSFSGVEKSYAIQAGREVRVFVTPDQVDDLKAIKLAREIADKIEQELKYPGEIKVNLIRETRTIEYAK